MPPSTPPLLPPRRPVSHSHSHSHSHSPAPSPSQPTISSSSATLAFNQTTSISTTSTSPLPSTPASTQPDQTPHLQNPNLFRPTSSYSPSPSPNSPQPPPLPPRKKTPKEPPLDEEMGSSATASTPAPILLNSSSISRDPDLTQARSTPPNTQPFEPNVQQTQTQPSPLPQSQQLQNQQSLHCSPVSAQSPPQQMDSSLMWLTLTATLTLLAYSDVSPIWLIVLGSAGYITITQVLAPYISHFPVQIPQQNAAASRTTDDDNSPVSWINHALYALFPLISTDILAPFIDLLEDALMEQVPPVVTSVRLTSAALGSQPLLLTSLRPISDSEWFASLSTDSTTPDLTQLSTGRPKGHRRSKSSASKIPLSSTKDDKEDPFLGQTRIDQAPSTSTSSSTPFVSTPGVMTPAVIPDTVQSRQRRDRVLRRLQSRRTSVDMYSNLPQSKSEGTGDIGDDLMNTSLANDGTSRQQVPHHDGTHQDDDDVGQFVNYQVGFEYKRTERTTKKGHGLHMLAFFGWGIKHVGHSEIPVYLDVLSIKGTLNLRLLLSPSPPFVRQGTFAFTALPEFDISAKPIRSVGLGSFNAMDIPLIKSYVQASIAQVAQAFIIPKSYTLDLDRLLLGRESSMRTNSIGVLHLVIHGAEDLPKTDTIGTCDPYVSVSLSKFNKPLFSTRTVVDTRSPSWEETTFILISQSSLEAGERLCLRVYDSDRFSSDDSQGLVQVELVDLVEQTTCPTDLPSSAPSALTRRVDELQAERPGMRTSGRLEWSVRFCPLWQIPEDQLRERLEKVRLDRVGKKYEPDTSGIPWWLEWMKEWVLKPAYEEEREHVRKETLALFNGEREREDQEALAKPSDKRRSGVLQCMNLELESIGGTFSATVSRRKSAASGKPALADVVDRTPAENPDPPSAYCEVHLNDKLVYRTRTKQMTPLPYFNAVSERFICDWRKAKIVFVVRDERDREHDPILGMVCLNLEEALKDGCHFTKWFPLIGGLGWGQLRLSLLFKPVDIDLPRGVSGFEAATLDITHLSTTDLSSHFDRPLSIMIETEHNQFALSPPSAGDSVPSLTLPTQAPLESDENIADGFPRGSKRNSLPVTARISPDSPGSSFGQGSTGMTSEFALEWELTRPIRLAVRYRHSCAILFTFFHRSGILKKRRVHAIAVLRLDDCEDEESCEKTIPIFATTLVKDAMKAAQFFSAHQKKPNRERVLSSDTTKSGLEAINGTGSGESTSRPTSKERIQIRTPSPTRRPNVDATLIGFLNLSLVVHPGVSRAHRKIAKRDPKLRSVYEAWEAARESEQNWNQMKNGNDLSDVAGAGTGSGAEEDGESDESGDSSDSEDEDSDEEAREKDGTVRPGTGVRKGGEKVRKTNTAKTLQDDDDEAFLNDKRAHSKALHKRHKGIFQLKLVRTGKYVKDKLEEKILSTSGVGGSKLDRREKGMEDFEREGQSKL